MIRIPLVVCLILPACHHAERDKPAPPTTQKGERRAHETLVYVDGVPRASLSISEAPKAATLRDYLLAIGVAYPREIHLYRDDGQVIADGRAAIELEAGARPRVGGAEINTITVYVDKTPPKLPVQGIPFLDEPVRGGTRVNVDGRLATRLKRNRIEGALTELEDGSYRFAEFLEQQKLALPRALELIQADESIVRVPDGELANLRFGAEEHQHGQMRFRFAERAVSAIAVNVYLTSTPPSRALPRAVVRTAGFSGGCDVTLGGGRAPTAW